MKRRKLNVVAILKDKANYLLAAILLVGLILRLWGIGFGLPYEYHPDEVQYVRQAASMGENGLRPTWWNNPPFYKYVLLGEYAGLYVAGHVMGWYASTADFGAKSILDPTWFYLLGRGTTALLGALTAIPVYLLGKAAFQRRAGLVAASFWALAFLPVRDSHFAVNDIPVTLLMTGVVLAAVLIAQTGKQRWYILAGICLGVGFGTKYSAIMTLIPLVVAHCFSPNIRKGFKGWLPWVWLVGCGLTSAFIASPYFLVEPGNVFHDAYQALILAGQQGFDGWQIDPAGGFVFYLKTLTWGLGWGLCLLCLAGIGFVFIRRSPTGWVLLSFIIPFYLMAGRQEMYFARFILPIIPVLLVLAGGALDGIINGIKGFPKQANLWVAGLVGLFLVLPFANDIRLDWLLTRPDTRTQAKAWIETNLLAGSKIAVDWPYYAPQLATPEKDSPQSNQSYQVFTSGGFGLADHPLEWYKQEGYQYLVTSSFISRIPLLDSQQNMVREAFYHSLEQNFTPVASFTASKGKVLPDFIFDEIYAPAVSLWQREQPGPELAIYQIQ